MSVVGVLFVGNPVPATACERVMELSQIERAMAVHVEEAKSDIVAEKLIKIVIGYPEVFAPAPSVLECDHGLRLSECSNGAFKGEWFGAFYVNLHEVGQPPIRQVVVEALNCNCDGLRRYLTTVLAFPETAQSFLAEHVNKRGFAVMV
jgi:hypothetical protein